MKTIKKIQEEIKSFDVERNWDHSNPLHLMLKIVEEISEFWSIIKYIDDINEMYNQLNSNIGEVEDFVGDQLYSIIKIANHFNLDAEKCISKTMSEYEHRFPVNSTRGKTSNLKKGGIDRKYSK